MSELKEKVVFLQGLAEGMEIEEASKEGKLLKSILEVLADMADEVAEMSTDLDEIYDYVDDNFAKTRNMFLRRKKTYEKLGYDIVDDTEQQIIKI